MHTETKQEKGEEAHAWYVLMMSQRTKEGGTEIYKRGFMEIMRETQLGLTYETTPSTMESKIMALAQSC